MVCSTTESHEEIVTKALQNGYTPHKTFLYALFAGLSVFVEKPVAQTVDSTKACYTLSRQTSRSLLCSFNRYSTKFALFLKKSACFLLSCCFFFGRFDPAIRSVYQRLRDDKVGQVFTVRTCSRDHPFPPLRFLKNSGTQRVYTVY